MVRVAQPDPLRLPLESPPAAQRPRRSGWGGAPARLPWRAAAAPPLEREGPADGLLPILLHKQSDRKGLWAACQGRPGSCLAKLHCKARRPEGSEAEVAAESRRAPSPASGRPWKKPPSPLISSAQHRALLWKSVHTRLSPRLQKPPLEGASPETPRSAVQLHFELQSQQAGGSPS